MKRHVFIIHLKLKFAFIAMENSSYIRHCVVLYTAADDYIPKNRRVSRGFSTKIIVYCTFSNAINHCVDFGM